MAAITFGQLLKTLRAARNLTQQKLAERTGLSPATIASYDEGRRMPEAATVDRLAAALGVAPAEHDQLRRAAGLRGLPGDFEAALRRGRGPIDTIWDEVQATDWVTLIVNDRREAVAWNRLANRTSELDLASLTQFQRSLLRMAATEHYGRHLVNWDELIGILISVFKVEGSDLSAGGANQFVQAVIESIGRENPEFLPRIFNLFLSVDPWPQEKRQVHPIHWRLDDGTELRFWGHFADWSNYDGMWAHDWHAADAETAAWVQDQLAIPGGESAPPPTPTFAERLHEARNAARLSLAAVARMAGLGSSTVSAYESGRRQPSRQAILALCRGLNIDGYSINRFLREAGLEEELSDWARFMAGDTPVGVYRGHEPVGQYGQRAIFATCDDVEWPSLILDQGCHVVHANRPLRRLAPLETVAPLPGRPGPHLMQLMVSDRLMESVRNWDTVAGVILPGRLEPLVLTAEREASANNLLEVGRQLVRTNPTGLDRLADVWRRSPGFANLHRPGVRFEWTTPEGDDLAFHCVISGITVMDPYKSLDLFPADPSTFAWLGRG